MASATITYRKPGTQPPIYVAGTFSEPPWGAYEMEYTTDDNGEHTFMKHVNAAPGSKIQYKFRVGEGEWWVLHDGKPTVTDVSGNTNHELEVQHSNEPTADEHGSKIDERREPSNNIPEGLAKHILASHSGASTPTYASVAAHGASTPDFANVAAEVADSAALLNKEKPETPIPDDLAGRIGYRRLSSTPIGEVARTAAEVADTAKELDSREANFYDEDDAIDEQPPLFPHEAAGMFDNVSYGGAVVEDYHREYRAPEDEDIDPDDIDINDPTLERFPSNREAIINTVRKLESGLNEDQASFDGAPLSPVVNMSRRGTEESTGDFVLSPIPVSPGIPRSERRLDVTRSPRGSITSAHSSTASLQAIAEAEEPGPEEEETRAPQVVRLPSPRGRSPLRNSFKSPGSDEDEGVVMKDTTSARSTTPGEAESSALSAVSPESSGRNDTILPENVEGASKSIGLSKPEPNGAQKSPRIVVEAPEDEGAATDEFAENSTTTGVDRGSNGITARRRKAGVGQTEQPATQGSVSSAAIPPEHEGGWFKAFFRLLFVDWIGGFISRLCGGGRTT